MILLSLVTLLIINSCCKDMECPDFDGLDNIQFYGYDRNEIDSVIVSRYEKGSGFSEYSDSKLIITEFRDIPDDFKIVWYPERFTPDFDYKIVITGTGESFTLTDFVLTRKDCHSDSGLGLGLFCSQYYIALKSYRLNGEIQTGALVVAR